MPSRQRTILIMAAHPVELEGLPAALDRLAQLPDTPAVVTAAVGVGLAAAGAGAARALAHHRPDAAILVGSAGHYPEVPVTIGDMIVAQRVTLADAAVARGQASFPEPMLRTDDGRSLASLDDALRVDLCRVLPHAQLATVATTLAITTDDQLALALAQADVGQVENLEAFAVALACQAADVRCAALLGITNRVGAHGRAQWRKHHRAVAAQIVEAVVIAVRTL